MPLGEQVAALTQFPNTDFPKLHYFSDFYSLRHPYRDEYLNWHLRSISEQSDVFDC